MLAGVRNSLRITRKAACSLGYGLESSMLTARLQARNPRVTSRFYSVNKETIARDRATLGTFTWKSAAVFVATGAGLYYYFQQEKEKMKAAQKKVVGENKYYGKPKLGGPFELVDQNGKTVTDKDFLGKYMLVYFGFTHCPDICPDELDKIGEVVDALESDKSIKEEIVPIFITCDPQRDSVDKIKEYVRDFHPKLIGMTGDFEQIKTVAKAYRVYFSKPPNVEEGEDYLVDHSIFFYLMGPDGKFIDCYGKESTAERVTVQIKKHIEEYRAAH
ncbi:mitochondrial metallochaperone Sco1 [Basidiobolus meristosporus CBS 931.73]|uniref:Mitochondrial metallochaperone Sco1 n=1 Tax=Basidiobolus meristosporus CBS 931.73 TaxID=1314790 RepID=A0A1Y1YRP9_9FUNG|nr:mitochondrial metallochaperone Sco1 [Basidiobolus meristosporus CBS 931.73]|eukprot:ORY00494.1 mitochondrial metallochaperone Sco1 [Basidiobolus meristosporus CBS 931.73]